LISASKITILTGHFGSGKTEIAINFALEKRKNHEKVAINDLDIINPYYRTRNVANVFQENDIELIAPKDHLATADLPIVSGEFYRVLHDDRYQIVVDSGGDKDGATALGQYYHEWKDRKVELLFVLNAKRPYVSTVDGVLLTINRIEDVSRLKVTGIINNTNIGSTTTMEDVLKGFDLSKKVSEIIGTPILYTTISTQLQKDANEFSLHNKVMFIDRFMKLPWEV
jgi:hypothetical protein